MNRPVFVAGSHVFEEEEEVDDEFSDIHSEFENICYKLILLSLHFPPLCLHISSVSSRVLHLLFLFFPLVIRHTILLHLRRGSFYFLFSLGLFSELYCSYFPSCSMKPRYLQQTTPLTANHVTYYKPRYLLQNMTPTTNHATYYRPR